MSKRVKSYADMRIVGILLPVIKFMTVKYTIIKDLVIKKMTDKI